MSTHNTREQGIEERVYELLEKHVHAEPDGENIKHEFHPLRREIHEDMVALLHQELQKAVDSERKEWIAGNRCRFCGGENLDSKGLSDVCVKCYEEQ